MKIDRNTIFHFETKPTDELEAYIENKYFQKQKDDTDVQITGCCGVICLTKFSF